MCGSQISIMALPSKKTKRSLTLPTRQAASSKKHFTQTFQNFSLKSGPFDRDASTNHYAQSLCSDLFLRLKFHTMLSSQHMTLVKTRAENRAFQAPADPHATYGGQRQVKMKVFKIQDQF